ncbi:general stress protein CsbD [Rhodoferax koreense]|uniref:General stress protein CsbD n=1 Tax=Rhodoferax koreensis TaxID=1842727 RepID=A0A1P8JXU0_9BURK|nr:CsbD family protein [Rhodoferax koreense]APW38572.1 general stress protein CsbD [Rhodoferax koreense]
MNSDRIEGNWKEFKGKLKEQWGKLTDDDLDVFEGRRDQLIGRIQQRHGLTQEAADREVLDWEKKNPSFFFEKS